MNQKSQRTMALLFLFVIFGMLVLLLSNAPAFKLSVEEKYKASLPENPTVVDKMKTVIQSTNAAVDGENLLRNSFIELNGGFQRLLSKRVIEDVNPQLRVVRMDDGRLLFTVGRVDTVWRAHNLADFSDWCTEKGTPFLYVQAPFKVDPNDPQLPTGIDDYNNANVDELLAELSKCNVETLDLRSEIAADNLSYGDVFYHTDSHWTTESALWATAKIEMALNERFSLKLDVADKSDFSVTRYENVFLGSQGKRVGSLYGGRDTVEVLLPKFETSLRYEVPVHKIDLRGSFEDTLIDYSHITPIDYYEKSPYYVYSGGDYPLSHITNEKNSDGPKILLVRDSFSCAVAPFLSLSVGSLDTFDLRYNTQPLTEYIEQSKPDIVLMMYNPGVLRDDVMFHYGLD